MNLQVAVLSLLLLVCSAQFVDEMQQIENECLGEDKFPCMGGGCILHSQYCDGVVNCEDGTDESFCADHPPDEKLCNETHHYMCLDRKKCIPKQWICNNEFDCDDGSDEANCTSSLITDNTTCGGFRCGDGKCISPLWVCDGKYDCEDKSDESNLDLCRRSLLQHTILDGSFCQEFPAIGERNYKCIDSSYCLPRSLMCNGMKDCRDGSDEGPFCKNWNNMCKNIHCIGNNTICSPERYGPICLCLPSATRQYNYSTHQCDDVDECLLDRPQCSHRCFNGDGHFKCECDEGYVKDDFGYLCYAKGPEAMLFFTTRNEIKFLKVKSKQLVTVATGIKQAHGVAYDGKYLYWVEAGEGHQSIVRAHLEDIEGTKEVLVGLGLEDPGDVSIDYLGGNIYFADAARGIFACRLDGTICTAIATLAKHPKYLTVDPRNGVMYWADWLDHAVIMSSSMGGSGAEALVALEAFATGLALDQPNGRLYYVDGTVKVLVINGRNVYSLFDEPFHHPYAISVFENTVYWSDWTSMTIQSADKLHGTQQKRNVILSLKTPVFGLYMYHPALMAAPSNPCGRHACSHLCLITTNATAACACPHGMELHGDNCTHIAGYRPQYLVVGGAQYFTRIELDSLGNPESHAAHFDIGRVQAMAYDNSRDTLYLYDGQRRTVNYINMSDFSLGLTHLFLYQGLDNVVDMDYDYATDNLYFLDAGRRLVEAVSLRTQRRALVYKFVGEEIPISFCIMPNYGRMLVAIVESEQNNEIHIDSIGLDGEGRHHVVMNNLKGPHIRLKYSQSMDNVFISDEGNGIIDTIHPGGTGRENYRELSTTVASLSVAGAHVFWSDRRTPRLFWADVHEASRSRRLRLGLFPNSTQLLLQATTSPPAPSDPLLSHPCVSSPSPCSAVCVQSSSHTHTLGYKCLCPPGLILQHGKCTHVVQCKEYELYCHRSNVCIEKRKYCDGVKDCTFGEDEAGCKVLPSYVDEVCTDTQFQCRNSTVCIERSLVCNSWADCPDRSDEAAAECDTLACFDTEFMCASGSCILKTWKCDGDSDCSDGTDEIGCENPTCKPGYYQCRDKECVELRRRCDGRQDCADGSDEDECDERNVVPVEEELLPHCEEEEYACELNKSICLPATARCNMKVDCPGGTDENGCDFRCHPHGLFACRQQLLCVPPGRLCDARRDCADGSDETPEVCAIVNKTSHLYPLVLFPAAECHDGFLCPNGQCVEWGDVCDNRLHCLDGGDEGGHCSTACVEHGCSHSCRATPSGAQCICPPGFHHAGPAICEDVDECQFEVCSQACTNTPGSFVCSCHHGYALRSDRRSCKAKTGNMSVLYVSGNTVRSVSADGYGTVEFSDPAIATISDLDYNVRKEKLYVTSAESRKLIVVNGTHSVIAVTNIGHPSRVAVDWITENVYFVDNTPGNSFIRVCNVRKKRCARLQKLPSDATVTSLIVDPKSRLMFYCVTRAQESVVWAAPLSGRSARDLAPAGLCTGLAADSSRRLLYVAETGPSRVFRMDYDGDGHTVILADDPHLEAPHSLALFEDHVYYLVANSFRLNRCLLFGQKHCETYIYRVFDANTFVIRHGSVQRDDVTDDCEGVACANVCVLDARGAACVCHDGSLAKGAACPLMKKDDLPLFNGWSYQDYLLVHNASFTVVLAAIVLLVAYLSLFVYYHFVYKPRKIRSEAYTEVRYQTNTPGAASLSYAPTVEMATDGGVSHEFVNPLQYARAAWGRSFRRSRPVGTAGLSVDVTPSPSHSQDYSDTESDFHVKESLIITK